VDDQKRRGRGLAEVDIGERGEKNARILWTSFMDGSLVLVAWLKVGGVAQW